MPGRERHRRHPLPRPPPRRPDLRGRSSARPTTPPPSSRPSPPTPAPPSRPIGWRSWPASGCWPPTATRRPTTTWSALASGAASSPAVASGLAGPADLATAALPTRRAPAAGRADGQRVPGAGTGPAAGPGPHRRPGLAPARRFLDPRAPRRPSAPAPCCPSAPRTGERAMPLALVTGSGRTLGSAGAALGRAGFDVVTWDVAATAPPPLPGGPFDCYVQLPCAGRTGPGPRLPHRRAGRRGRAPRAGRLRPARRGRGRSAPPIPGPAPLAPDLLAAVALALLEDLGRLDGPGGRSAGRGPLPAGAGLARIDPVIGSLSGRCRRRLWSRRRSGRARRSRSSRPIRFRASTAPASIWSAGTIQAISNSIPSGSWP